jgi:hypothetical protein
MREIRVDDFVKYREDRPPPDLRNVGKVGRVVDPGRTPSFPTYVFVQFPGEPECEIDRGALVRVSGPQ